MKKFISIAIIGLLVILGGWLILMRPVTGIQFLEGSPQPTDIEEVYSTNIPVQPTASPTEYNPQGPNGIRSISFDTDGGLWSAGLQDLVKWNLEKKTCTRYAPPSGWDGDSLYQVLVDYSKHVWVSTYNDIWEYRVDERAWLRRLPELTKSLIKRLTLAPDGTVWANADKIYQFDGENQRQIESLVVEGTEYGFTTMVIMPDGSLWVNAYRPSEGPIYKGVWRYDEQEWRRVTELAGDRYYMISQAQDKALWFLYVENLETLSGVRVERFDGATWEHRPMSEIRGITDFLTTNDGTWIVANADLYNFTNGTPVLMELPFHDVITDIAYQDAALCLGTQGNGVWCQVNGEWQNYRTTNVRCD